MLVKHPQVVPEQLQGLRVRTDVGLTIELMVENFSAASARCSSARASDVVRASVASRLPNRGLHRHG